ncbi:MAG: hypothetical protein Unbinned4512contig1001_44 [Prokaryotic dsDNA virus sp.]|nr:MAG: hypothetical protein Unbinned4512contig1001_44 [Prokaryotic dsDNA virus sp.]|tara:strand:- start:101 stop:664 length:564 start_codon:yes stop_codon:yes gene_type:complete
MSFLAALQTAAAEAAAAVAESSIGQTLKSGVETVSDMGAKLDPSEKFNFDPFGGNTGNFSSGFNPNPNPNLNINSNPQAMNDFLSVTNSLNVSNPAAAMMTNLDSGVSIPSINLPQNNANNLSSLEKQELEGFRERFKNIQDVIDADGPYSPEKLITQKEFIPTIVSPQGYLSSPANNNNGMLFENR